METPICESTLENFLSKRALRLLGLFLSFKGKSLLEKKDALQIQAIQSIFWKALRPTFNRVYIHTSRAGERLRSKFDLLFLRSDLAFGNFKSVWPVWINPPHVNQFSAIKKIIKPCNVQNVNPKGRVLNAFSELETSKGLSQSSRVHRLFSELLSRSGKLKTLCQLLSEIESKIPVNSGYEYNRKKIECSNVRRLFWRQSKRTINRLSKDLQKNKNFGAKTNHLVRSEACAICSLDECVDEDDVFVYCDCCSILVHRKCLWLDAEEIKKCVWFCPNCRRLDLRKKNLQKLILGMTRNEGLDVACGRRKKDQIKTTVVQVLRDLFELSEGVCVFCGKGGSITLPIQGVPDHFGHISCAKWIDQVNFSKDFDEIVFLDKGELIGRLNPFNSPLGALRINGLFFSTDLYPVDNQLSKIFQVENFDENLKKLKMTMRMAFKSSSPCLNKNNIMTFSSRLKRNNDLKRKSKHCKCLFHSLISTNSMLILRRILCIEIENSKDENIFKKISSLIVNLYPFIKGNYHRPRCP